MSRQGCALLLAAIAPWAAAPPAAAQQAGPRIAAITATLQPDSIEASALVTGSPARVVIELVPARVTPAPPATRVEATRTPARAEAVAAFGPTAALWVARLPAPARFGAFRGRVIALDAAGAEVARSEADWVRPFPARFHVTASTPVADVSAGPQEAVVRIEVAGADAIDAIAVQTDAHVGAELGFGALPYEAAQDARNHGPTFPPIAVRLSRLDATRFELRFAVPVGTPARTLTVDRVYVRSRSGHTAEESIRDPAAVVRVTDTAARPAALDVLVGGARGELAVAFRYQGPVVGRARTRLGFPVPNVEARVRDRLRLVRARCVPDEIPIQDPPWDGSRMRCTLRATTRGAHPLLDDARLSIVAGNRTIGEAPLAALLGP